MYPGQDFLVRAALQCPLADLRIRHAQKAAAAPVQRVKLRIPQQHHILLRQLPLRMQTDFIINIFDFCYYLKIKKLSTTFENLSKRKLSVMKEYGLSWFVLISFKPSHDLFDAQNNNPFM
jgi:hypothetical protein